MALFSYTFGIYLLAKGQCCQGIKILHRKLVRAPNIRKNSKYEASGLGQFTFKNFPLKQHLHEPISGIPVWGYNRSCGKSNVPARLTLYNSYPRCEDLKFATKMQFEKANKHYV
jgi:hypothetical protein